MGRNNYGKRAEKSKLSVLKEIFGFLIYVAVVVGITFLIITFVGQRTYVSGSSMENTLSDGDNLIVDKITYRFTDPQRFDIIVFPFQYGEKVYYIKRIIGLPGETIRVQDGEIYVDGEKDFPAFKEGQYARLVSQGNLLIEYELTDEPSIKETNK